MSRSKLRLCVITEETPDGSRGHLDVIAAALQGGAPCIQLRVKNRNGREYYQMAKKARELCSAGDALLIINDRVDIALAIDADGVHLGQNDLPYEAARRLMGPDKLIGLSATDEASAMAAARNGADYIGYGPVFATQTKTDAARPTGLESLGRVRRSMATLVMAIGGIDLDNLPAVLAAGVDAVAVISAISRSLQPSVAVRQFMSTIDRSRSKE